MSRCVWLVVLWLAAVVHARADVTGDFSLSEAGVLIDQAGRTLRLDRPFERVISLYAAHTENLFFLGLEREVIGVTRQDRCLEKAAAKPVFSCHDDPEKFLAARPDLVLIRPMIDRGYAKLMHRLRQSGIHMVSMQPASVADMYRYWAILGALTGRQDAAARMIRRFQAATEAFSALAAPIQPKPRVYFEAMHANMRTFVQGSMADFVLTAAGGVNIAADGAPSRGTNIAVYNKERILAKAGRIDVFLAQTGTMNRPTRTMIEHEPGFGMIKAVKEGRIYFVDEMIVSRPTPRLLHGIREVGDFLYPETNAAERRRILESAFAQWKP